MAADISSKKKGMFRLVSDSAETTVTESASSAQKRWERTQSEVFLPGQNDQLLKMASSDQNVVNGFQGAPDKASEHAKVYWDLPGAVEDTAASYQRQGKMKVTLQTIHQKEELKSSATADHIGHSAASTIVGAAASGAVHQSVFGSPAVALTTATGPTTVTFGSAAASASMAAAASSSYSSASSSSSLAGSFSLPTGAVGGGCSIVGGSSSSSSGSYGSYTSQSGSYGGETTQRTYTVFEKQTGPNRSAIRISKRQSSVEALFPPSTEFDVGKPMTPGATTVVEYPHVVCADSAGGGHPPPPPTSLEFETRKMKDCIAQLSSDSVEAQQAALSSMLNAVDVAWESAPQSGDSDFGRKLCDVLRTDGGLVKLMDNCSGGLAAAGTASGGKASQLPLAVRLGSARIMAKSLTKPNRDYVASVGGGGGLEVVVRMLAENKTNPSMLQAGSGILRSMFKHSESTCGRLVDVGGLDVVVFSCRSSDRVTQRNAAAALANLALCGGGENQGAMVRANAHDWLFTLAFSDDDVVRYYACLAVCALTTSKELSAAIQKSGTVRLVEPFLSTHTPEAFARLALPHSGGKASEWLRRLVPMLSSDCRQAQAMAAFHFAMEAHVKSQHNCTKELYDIGAVEPLKELASSPNKFASRLAREALRTLGEALPYVLSAQVPLWTTADVQHWVKQIGFTQYQDVFLKLQVDGDILLRLSQDELRDDIGMTNGITRKRFQRHLNDLKVDADYSSSDSSGLCAWLNAVDPSLLRHAYPLLVSGLTRELLSTIDDVHLKLDGLVENGVQRLKILKAAGGFPMSPTPDQSKKTGFFPATNKSLDVFISYRRSTGSQLASLLKVHLQLRGFKVFLDIEKLTAGRFDERLLNSIRNAKNFILVLTSQALDRCVGDDHGKDWVHLEVVAALSNNCNIVPVTDDYDWPQPEKLPEDMRNITRFNGVRWIHDYQDACVDKIESFLRGDDMPQGSRMAAITAIECPPSLSATSTPAASLGQHKV